MNDGLRAYSEYKDSGQPWLGKVPAHWGVSRLRHAAELLVSNVDKHTIEGELPVRLCNYVDVYKNRHITDRIAFKGASATREEIDRFRIRIGDVLITKDSEAWNDIGVPSLVEYEADDLICGYHLAILRPYDRSVIGGFLLYALQANPVAAQFHVEANGVTRYGLSHGAIKDIIVPVPPPAEQAAIAQFLAVLDRGVNRFVRAKRRLIELLTEQKQAIITHAVTRGLNPNAKLKPSGIDWLGDVPEHWEVLRLGRVIDLLTGFPFPSSGFSQSEVDIRLLRGVNVAPGALRWEQVVHWPSDKASLVPFKLQAGDVVLGMDRPIIASGIRVAVVSDLDLPCYLLQRVCRIRPKTDIEQRFIPLLLASKVFADYLAPIFTGISVPHVSPEQIGGFQIALPPLDEQAQIIEHVSDANAHAIAAIGIAEREITLIREYRTRLVADVVTGKLDVREAAARLPEAEAESATWNEVESQDANEQIADEVMVGVAEEGEA